MPDWTASTGGHHSDTLTADPHAATDTATTATDPHAATQPHSTVSFFANLLNPALVHDPAFAYTNASPYTMASSRPHPARLSNGYVDLTSPHLDLTPHVDLTDFTPHVDLTDPDPPSRRRNRDSPTPGPSSKRLKRAHGTAAESPTTTPPAAPMEQIDLLNKQREDAIKAQPRPVETVTTFNSFTCVICMDRPIDITATACGAYNHPFTLTTTLLTAIRPPLLPYLPDGSAHRR